MNINLLFLFLQQKGSNSSFLNEFYISKSSMSVTNSINMHQLKVAYIIALSSFQGLCMFY